MRTHSIDMEVERSSPRIKSYLAKPIIFYHSPPTSNMAIEIANEGNASSKNENFGPMNEIFEEKSNFQREVSPY